MMKELKATIKKLMTDETFVGSIIVFIIVVVAFFILLCIVDATNTNDLRARCRSLDGKYGKGKCYVKGKEV